MMLPCLTSFENDIKLENDNKVENNMRYKKDDNEQNDTMQKTTLEM